MPDNYGLEDTYVNTNFDRTKWVRVDPESGGLYRYNSANGQYDIPLPIALASITGLTDALAGKADISHSHATHGDINFTGSVSAGGDAGITGSKTVGGYRITFKKGLLTGFEQVETWRYWNRNVESMAYLKRYNMSRITTWSLALSATAPARW